jgi:hypothetical protein
LGDLTIARPVEASCPAQVRRLPDEGSNAQLRFREQAFLRKIPRNLKISIDMPSSAHYNSHSTPTTATKIKELPKNEHY